jgi:hypothetical protein
MTNASFLWRRQRPSERALTYIQVWPGLAFTFLVIIIVAVVTSL